MQAGSIQADFFMGCNSPEGFCSLYGELQKPVPGVRRFLLKGGAGTGKSSLMRRVAAEFQERETLTERIHCSSDPDSLDGVILHSGRVSIVDATPPHVRGCGINKEKKRSCLREHPRNFIPGVFLGCAALEQSQNEFCGLWASGKVAARRWEHACSTAPGERANP